MNYHRIASLVIAGILPFILWTCVDVNNPNIPTSINYHSLVRFINLAGDNPAAGAITIDNAAVGTITYGNTSAYASVRAGSRHLGYSGASQLVNFITDDQYTVVVHSLSSGTDRFIPLDEGYSFKNNSVGKPDTTEIKFINSAVGFGANLTFRQDSLTGNTVSDGVGFGKSQVYTQLTSGKYVFFVISNGGYLANLTGAQAVPPVATTSTGTGTMSVSFDNGMSYSIQVVSDNTAGLSGAFYTSAGFHTGATGVKGPLDTTIDVSGQAIGFPNASLVPVDTLTKATGSVSGMTLTPNATLDTFQLSYTFSITADPTDTPAIVSTFINAEFHLGSITGPVVHGIATGPFRDTTISGVWATSDFLPLTPALVDSLLKGRIYVTFRTTRHATGELTWNVQPVPTSKNTFSGTWSDMANDLKDSVRLGRMYVSFATLADTAGQIRGQLAVDSTVGNYGTAMLDSVTYNAGATYTVVAVDSGSTTLKLFELANRQSGVAATVQSKLPAPQSVGTKNFKK